MARSDTTPDIRMVPVADLHTDPKNPRRITEREMDRLKRSITEDPDFMRLRPILARPDGSIYAGNMRFEAAKALGWTEVPAIVTDDPEAVLKKRAVKDNTQFGEWVEEELAEYLSDLAEADPDLDFGALGLTDDIVRTMGMEAQADLADLHFATGPDGRPGETVGGVERPYPTEADTYIGGLHDASPDLKGALKLAEEVIYLYPDDAEGIYGYPLMRPERFLEKLPEPLETWGGGDTGQDDGHKWFLYNYSPHKTTSNAPLERCILSFFTSDKFFLPWFDQPAYYVGKMLNAGIRMAVEPDVTAKMGGPPALSAFRIYQARWLARYMQDAGIAIIPRIPYPEVEEDFSETSSYYNLALTGFPKYAPIMAVNAHSGGTSEFWREEYAIMVGGGMAKMWEDGYRCDTLLVYGENKTADSLMNHAKVPSDIEVKVVKHFLAVRRDLGLPYRES